MLTFMYNKFEVFINNKFIDFITIPTDKIVLKDIFIVLNSYIYYCSTNGNMNCASIINKKGNSRNNLIVADNAIYIHDTDGGLSYSTLAHNYKKLKIIIDNKEYYTQIRNGSEYIFINECKQIVFEAGMFSYIPFGKYCGNNNALINMKVRIIHGVANFDLALFKTEHITINNMMEYYES